MNLAAAPIFNKLGYPQLAVTANTNQALELTKRWPNLTFWLGLPSEIVDGIVETFAKLEKDGKINKKIAMIAVGDQFGIELSTATRAGLKKAGFDLVYDKSYPFGTQDMKASARRWRRPSHRSIRALRCRPTRHSSSRTSSNSPASIRSTFSVRGYG